MTPFVFDRHVGELVKPYRHAIIGNPIGMKLSGCAARFGETGQHATSAIPIHGSVT